MRLRSATAASRRTTAASGRTFGPFLRRRTRPARAVPRTPVARQVGAADPGSPARQAARMRHWLWTPRSRQVQVVVFATTWGASLRRVYPSSTRPGATPDSRRRPPRSPGRPSRRRGPPRPAGDRGRRTPPSRRRTPRCPRCAAAGTSGSRRAGVARSGTARRARPAVSWSPGTVTPGDSSSARSR